jgi:hypothetical protein
MLSDKPGVASMQAITFMVLAMKGWIWNTKHMILSYQNSSIHNQVGALSKTDRQTPKQIALSCCACAHGGNNLLDSSSSPGRSTNFYWYFVCLYQVSIYGLIECSCYYNYHTCTQALYRIDCQSAKFNSPPNFPAIQ